MVGISDADKEAPMFLSLKSLVVVVFISGICCAGDWKWGGYSKVNGSEMILFYDSASIMKTPAGTRFWTKSVKLTAIEAFIKKREDYLVDALAKKFVARYRVPYLEIDSIRPKEESEFRESLGLAIQWEIAANEGDLPVASRFLWEIDCSQKRIRALDGTLYDKKGNPKSSSRSMSGDWSFCAPDTQGAWWSELMCVK
jgi:hypothetical protein